MQALRSGDKLGQCSWHYTPVWNFTSGFEILQGINAELKLVLLSGDQMPRCVVNQKPWWKL